jgi:hypothetical protein
MPTLTLRLTNSLFLMANIGRYCLHIVILAAQTFWYVVIRLSGSLTGKLPGGIQPTGNTLLLVK